MFRVDWLQKALDELTILWTQADSTQQQAITTASHAVEQRLRNDPANSTVRVQSSQQLQQRLD